MLIDIDISLLTPKSAVGRLYGAIELAHLPKIGETVSLPIAASADAGFNGHTVVEHVIRSIGTSARPLLSLGDIVASDEAAARSIASALEKAYGLFFEQYDHANDR
ncbi:MAG: hypothetical protein EOO15_14115 [Chitinophagaceae bacterium]|nr:MAG: hypothetical protein EOO15_14115 [Chitinophagaceae bacterium]